MYNLAHITILRIYSENTLSYTYTKGLPIGSITKQPKKISFRLPVVVSSTVAEVIFDKLNLNK